MTMHTRLRALALFAACGTAAAATEPFSGREVLPDDVVPLHYDLSLSPDAEALTFRGSVTITVDVRASTARITLNEEGLTLDHAKLDSGADAQVAVDEHLGRATLRFAAPAAVGEHQLAIAYHGTIGRTTLGFFAMDYAGSDGPRRTLATNFEPAAARRLLPCWDEPGRKATFTVAVDAPDDRLVLSNMPVADITPLSATQQRVRFLESPEMSTYLLFVGIGDFERVHKPVDGVDVGVVVKRGDTAKAAYALEQAGTLLRYYNDYFGVAYPLPKLDLIAAPGQITGGSMENWGAIFYSQDHVLFDPKTSTEADRERVFMVVSHEMAHQWFGDLVTMAWWDDLWLNEGFARWMQTFAADDLHPEWQTGLEAQEIFESGKQADALPSTHAVVQTVLSAAQAEQAFDSITYDKGAAIITMLNAYEGRDAFRTGVRRYMRAHAFGNTVDADLWAAMPPTNKPVADVAHDFTHTVGVPLVRVNAAAHATQLDEARFADDMASLAHVPPPRWRLPLAVGGIGAAAKYILLQGAARLPATPDGGVLVNAGQAGYARVSYSPPLTRALAVHLADLHAVDQIGLLNDARALAFAGLEPAEDLLEFSTRLPVSADVLVWRRLIGILGELERHYGDTPQRTAFRRFALQLLEPLAARLGRSSTPGESPNQEILRTRLLEAQSKFGDAAVLELARQRYDTGAGSPAEQRSALAIVAAHADAHTFDGLLARALTITDPLEKQHYFQALAGVLDPALAARMLEVALGKDAPAGAAPDLILRIAGLHPDLAWRALEPRLESTDLPLDQNTRWLIAGWVAAFSADPQRVGDLETYVARSVAEDARKPFAGFIASIRMNERVARDILPVIDRWLAAHAAPPAARLCPGSSRAPHSCHSAFMLDAAT